MKKVITLGGATQDIFIDYKSKEKNMTIGDHASLISFFLRVKS